MKKLLLLLFGLSIGACPYAQNKPVPIAEKMKWWNEAKLGMFIHWGPYSIYGGEYHGYRQVRGGAEWIMNRCKIPVMEYRAAATTFNPVNFDADAWVRLAHESGMKYIVFTTKHHDGFAMFKSDADRFNIVDYTPFGRDVVAELADACRKYDMKLGFYYSQSQDWCHPGGATARRVMAEGWANPDSTCVNAFTEANKGAWDAIQRSKTFDEYFDRIAIPQIRELLTRYGDVATIFWDTPMQISEEQAARITAILDDYPHIVQNDRLRRPDFPGDYKTPEGRVPEVADVVGVYWETCMNIGSSWGYKSWDQSWKTPESLIRTLVTIAARGGNLLLNIGPDSRGNIPHENIERLDAIGKWMATNGEAIYGTQRSEMTPAWGEVTRKDGPNNTVLYLCVYDWPEDGLLKVNLEAGVRSASMLPDGAPLKVNGKGGTITVGLPAQCPDPIVSVVKLELRGKLPAAVLSSNTQKYFEIVDQKD